jgi:hypothetical protein
VILIERSSQNIVALTLSEFTTITGANYIFVFTYTTTGTEKIFTCPDISPAVTRYNKFMITETETEDLFNGEVNLEHVGFWNYKVYQTDTSSPVDLDDIQESNLVEQGIVKVIEDLTAGNILDENYTNNHNVLL